MLKNIKGVRLYEPFNYQFEPFGSFGGGDIDLGIPEIS
jgi:hypothetical protein